MKNKIFAFIIVATCIFQSRAEIPPAGRILPDDTLFMLTVPDVDKMSELRKNSPQMQLWNDPAMKPFKDKFTGKFRETVITPLERELGINFEDYTSLPHGQFTFAVTRSGGEDATSPDIVLLIDTKAKSAQLKSNLASLGKKWVDSGKTLRTQKLHGIEFTVLPLSAVDMPKTLKKFFGNPETDPADADGAATKKETKDVLVYGQFESLLIIGNTTKAVDNIATRLSESSAPVLGDVAAFGADLLMFRDSPVYAWANTRVIFDWVSAVEKSRNQSSDSGPSSSFVKTLAASGFSGLKSVSFNYVVTSDGFMGQFFLRAPESSRQGIFKVIAGDAKDASPPPFVPADVLKFQRWRLDGQKVFAAIEKMAADISPQTANMINYLIESANSAVHEKDPGFDLRKNLIGNIGNDFISYQKGPSLTTPAAVDSAPVLYLIGSPNTEKLVGSLQALFRLMSPGGPEEREFLGRKIYTITLPVSPAGMPATAQPATRKLIYAATSAYVAISTEASILEEYLRSSEKPPKALRDIPGLTEAAQKVSGTSTGWFGYENQSEAMKILFEAMRKSVNAPNATLSNPYLALLSTIPGIGDSVKDWLDFSLLPPFEKVSKYFSFTVYANSASVNGLTFKIFAPLSPQLRN